jgi:hypothetical protein
LSDVASRVQLSGPSDAEKYILNMVSVNHYWNATVHSIYMDCNEQYNIMMFILSPQWYHIWLFYQLYKHSLLRCTEWCDLKWVKHYTCPAWCLHITFNLLFSLSVALWRHSYYGYFGWLIAQF